MIRIKLHIGLSRITCTTLSFSGIISFFTEGGMVMYHCFFFVFLIIAGKEITGFLSVSMDIIGFPDINKLSF